MEIQINVQSAKDVAFEGCLLLAPASNYCDGEDRGERPAITWAIMRLKDNVMHSGMFCIKDQPAQETAEEAITIARECLFEDDGICDFVMNEMLEEYEREP